MKPVLIIQHEDHLGPGTLLECLRRHGLPSMLLRPELGQGLPAHAGDFSGVVLLGSERHVRDELPWIHAELRLCASALAHDVPVLGHAFGAQLLATASGARVLPCPTPTVGWSHALLTPEGQALFGGAPLQLLVFNAHAHTFELPRGARRLMFERRCMNLGFALGPHLALQCHLDLRIQSLRDWCALGSGLIGRARGPAVQSRSEILRDLPQRLQQLDTVAQTVYGSWCERLLQRPQPRLVG